MDCGWAAYRNLNLSPPPRSALQLTKAPYVMSMVIVINDSAYGSERPYNALRPAYALGKVSSTGANTVFLMADAVLVAKAGQHPPEGCYNPGLMPKRFLSSGGKVLLCGSCMDARGLSETEFIEGRTAQHDG